MWPNFYWKRAGPLVSQDALRIDDHPNVRLLYTLLQFVNNPKDEEAAYQILLALSVDEEDTHQFIDHWRSRMDELFIKRYQLDWKTLSALELYDKCIALVSAFDLAREGQAYVAAFLEEVLAFESSRGNLLNAFIAFWEENGSKKTLPSPEGIDALQLMTIHKSKGLEFKVVLFPFADYYSGRLHEQQMWAPTSIGSDDLDCLPISCSNDMKNYPLLVRAATEREWAQQQLDQINVLYVAFTRASERLHLWSEVKDKLPGGPLISLAYWLPQFLKQKGIWQQEQQRFVWGSNSPLPSEPSETKKSLPIPWLFQTPKDSYSRFLRKPRLSLETPEARNAIGWGNLMHDTLSMIQTPAELENVLEKVSDRCHREGFDLEVLKGTLTKLLNDPRIKEFYQEGIQAFNEREMINVKGELFRPDRLVIKGQEAHLLEFKTGLPASEHQQQLHTYAEILTQMKYQPKTLALVYLQDPPEVVFL